MSTGSLGNGTTMWIMTEVAPYVDGPAGVHGVLPQAEAALRQLARMAGLEPVMTSSADLVPEELTGGGVLALFTIGETPFSEEQRRAVYDAWADGHLGILGVHAATDACRTWPEYGQLLGARFDGHPWTRDFDVMVVDGSHPATAHLSDPWRWRDELYLFAELRPEVKVLLQLSSTDLDMTAAGARVPDCGFPLAWSLEDGRGRTFYTALGHFPHAWETPAYLRHLAGGLAWLRS